MGVCSRLIKAPITESVLHKARLYSAVFSLQSRIGGPVGTFDLNCFGGYPFLFLLPSLHWSLHSVSVCNGLKNVVISRTISNLHCACELCLNTNQKTGLRTVKPIYTPTLLVLFILDYFWLGLRRFAHVAGTVWCITSNQTPRSLIKQHLWVLDLR